MARFFGFGTAGADELANALVVPCEFENISAGGFAGELMCHLSVVLLIE